MQMQKSSHVIWLMSRQRWCEISLNQMKRTSLCWIILFSRFMTFFCIVSSMTKRIWLSIFYTNLLVRLMKKFRRISSLLSSKKWRRLSSSCKRSWKNVLLFKIKHSKEWLNYRHCINARDTIVTISIDTADEISILIIIMFSSLITSHAEIRFLIMKFWVLMLEISSRWSRRIYSQWLEEEIRRKNFQHHHRLHLFRLWLFLRFIHLHTPLHLQSHLQSHLQLHMLHIQLHI